MALLFVCGVSAAQAQWFQVRNIGGSGTPGQPGGTIYVGDTGLTFTCNAWGTLEGAWGGSQVWIHTGTDIHNGTAGAATSFTSSETKSNTSGRFTSAGTWYWGMRIQYNRSGGTTVGWYNRNISNWENAYGTPDSNLTVTVTAIPSPTSQTATATSSSNINLSWTRASTSSARNTLIFRSTSSTPPTLTQGTDYNVNDTVSGATCIYDDAGTSTSSGSLAAGTQYYYHFFAINNNYYSAASTATATTWAVPAAPTLGTITPGNGQLSIAFTAGANNGSAITNYKWSIDGTTYTAFSPATTASPLVITGLNNGTAYTVRIRAVNAVGDGAVATASASSTPRTTPGAPTITGITAGSQQLSVAFTAPSSNGGNAITNYEFSTNGGSSWTVRNPASTTSPLVITGLNNGTSYSVRIRAVNDAGQGTQSDAVSGTPVAAPTLTAVTLTSALSGTYGTPSSGVSFTATGTSLSSNITVTAQSGFEVSTSSGSGYGSSVSVAGGTTVYVRTAATRAAGAANDTVVAVLSGGGAASSVNVTSSGSSNSVATATLTITGLTAAAKTYDGATTASVTGTPAYSGLVNSESFSVTGTVTWAFPSATAGNNKTLTRTGSYNAPSSNYTVTQPTLTANITTRSLTITASNVTKTYGDTLTGGSGSSAYTASGQVSGEIPGTVAIAYTGSPSGAAATAAAGTYTGTVVPSALTGGSGGFSTSNYSISYVNGNVTVNKKQLTATAGNQTVVTGTAASTVTGNGTVTYTDFISGESASNVTITGTPTFTTTYTSSDAAGTAGRTITPVVSGLSATNYSFTPANGTITVVNPNYGLRDDGGVNLPTLTYSANGVVTTQRGSQFNGTSLGSNVSSLSLTGANIQIWKQSGGNVTNTRLEYKIWRTGESEPASYTQREIGYVSEVTGGTTTQVWSSFGAAIDLISGLGTNYGTYNLMVRFTVQGTGNAGTVTDGPFTATFIYPQPPAITINSSSSATATAFTTTYGTGSTAQTFTIAGSNLTADITATAPTGFQVSTNGSTWGTTATFTRSGTTASGTLHVRLAPTAAVAGTYNSQNITLASTGATTSNITTASSGNSVARKSLGITVASQTIKFGFPATGSTSVTAGAAVNGYTVTTADLVNGETSSVISGTPTYSTTYVQGDVAGTEGRTITVSGLSASNYTLNITNGTATINTLQNPTATATATGTTTINVVTTNDDFVMIVRHTVDTWTAPTQGTSYSAGNSLGSGIVRYVGGAGTFTDTGLAPGTQYFYKVYTEYYNRYSTGATTTSATTTGSPAITVNGSTSATATAFSTTYGAASTAQTFTVAASNLTANITATAPTGFQVSTNGSTWGTTATFAQSSGSVSGTLHVRLAATAAVGGTYNSQNITLASTDATTRNITTASTGNAVNRKAITVTANDQTVVFGTSIAVVTGDGSVTYTGFENGDTSSVITGTPTYTTTYTASTAADTAGVTITPVTTSLTATNYSFTPANGAITVTPLNNPGNLTVSKNSSLPMTSVNLSWAKAQNRDVLVVRSASDSDWTAPTVGLDYNAGDTLGSGTVVYEGGATSVTDNGLAPGATYFYRFYSENYLTYSTGATGSSVTLDAVQARNAGGAATPSVTLTNGSNATIYVGDQARFSFDATGTIPSSTDTNWGQPRLRLKFNNADLSTGFIGTTNTANGGFTDQINKTIIATNRFTNSGTWYWAMQMSYGSTYGSAFWYKASSSTYANMAADGTGSTLSFAVTALPDPTTVTVTSSSPTTNTISFTRTGRTGSEFAAMVVRKSGSAVDWTPTPGATYSNNFSTNGNTIIAWQNFTGSVTDTNLTAGTAYHYKVFSENWGYYSEGVTATVTTVPSAPAAPTISAVTGSNFTATWVNPGGATNYFLDVSPTNTFASFVTGYSNKAVAALSDSITGLAANTTYFVRVRAQSSGGTSTNSPTASQLTAPTAPAEPTATTVLATSFTANWTPVTGATGYRLDVATDSAFTSFVTGFDNKTVSGTTDSVTGLTEDTDYFVRVRAVNDGGTGASSATLNVSTAATATAPSISGITAGNAQLTVDFIAGESGGLTITDYEYSLNGGAYTSAGQTTSPIVITGLTNGTSYTVRIRAVNDDATFGTPSAGVSSTPRTTPGAPTSLTVTPGNTQLTASFTAPADNGGSAITNYEYSLNGGTSFTAVSPTSTSTNITITGLTNGTAYDVQVRAVNLVGAGAATDSVAGTPRTTPSVATGASSSVAAYSAALAGNITNTGGNNPSVRGFEYSTTDNFTTGTGTQTSSSGNFSTGAFTNSVTNLASGSTYYYRAFASNSAGISYGAQSNFTTLTVPGGRDPDTVNATTAFLGDTVPLRINAWKTFNSTARSFGAVFGRFGNANLTTGTSESNTNGVSPSLDQFSVNTSRLTNTGTFYWAIRVSWGAGNDYWFDGPRAGWTDLGLSAPTNSPLTIEVSPLNNPTSVTATNTSASQIILTWAKGISGNAKNTMIVRSTDTNFTAPTQGTAYAVNSTALGGDTVVYNDGGTNFSDTGLTAGTTYYYRLYAENFSYYSAGADATASTPGTPTITIGGVASNATTTAFTTTFGTASAAQSFPVGGSNLTTNIVATAPTGFQISSDDSAYTNTLTFTQSGGTASGTLWMRLSAAANVGNYNSASVTLTSSGATNRTITTPGAGNSVAQATPTIEAMPTVGSSIMRGDTLSNGLLSGGSASVSGTFGFSDLTNRQTTTGAKAVTFTPTDTTNFASVSTNLSVTVDAVPDPTAVSATNNNSTNSISLTHTRSSNRNVMIVRRAGSAVTFTPNDGTAYSIGQSVGDGQTVVHGSRAADSTTDSGLLASTTYHYKIFSENWGYYSAGVAASAATASPGPGITVSGSLSPMSTTYGTASTSQSVNVTGSSLTGNINVTAPVGFEVSTSVNSGYAETIALTPSSGTVASTTLHVRIRAGAAPGSLSGNVSFASTGSTTQNVAASGTVTVPTMAMTVTSSAGALNGDYGATKLFADEVAGTSNSVTITFIPGAIPDEVEIWTNLNNRDRADNDANSDGIPDGIVPPNPPTDKPEGYVSGTAYPANGYFQAIPMDGSNGTYTLTLNANKTGAYRLTARYRMNGGPWVWYNDAINGLGAKNRDHAITVSPTLSRNMNVYEINTLNINATGSRFDQRSTFESLTNSANGRVNLDYLRNLGVNTLWFQPVHPNGISGREPSGGWDSGTAPYDPGSPYAVKNFFEVMAEMSQGNSREASLVAFTNFVAAADNKGVHVMLDAPFNHTAYDVEFGTKGLQVLAGAGLNTSGWSATDEIRNREARFFSRNDGANAYNGPASSAGNAAVAPDRNDFGKWRDVLDVFFGRYSTLVTGNPSAQASRDRVANTEDTINMDDLRGTGGVSSETAAVTRAVWQYFAAYVPYWLEKTGLPANASAAEQATKGVDGLRADFGQGMPPQFWEYAINVAREHKWSFVFMTESLDGGLVTYRSNRHFDILNENIVFPWQQATTTSAHRTIFDDRRNSYGQGLVLLNNTSHDEAGYADPWQAFIHYAVGSTIDGAPMIMYGQEIGTGAGTGANTGSFDWFEFNFQKWIPHFKRYNSMEKQWTAWNNNSFGVRNLMPNYSGVGLAREFSAALRSTSRWFLNPIGSNDADPDIFAVAKYETANASPATSDVVLGFVNLRRDRGEANTFGIPSNLGTLLGIEPNQLYNVKNIAAYLGPNNEYPNRRSEFLWPTPRLGSDIISNGIYVSLNGVPTTDGGWTNAPFEAQYLKVYVAPGLTTGGSPSALTTIYGSASTNTSFTLSANNVHDGVTVTAPVGFQVSTNASSGFASSFSFTNTGTIGATTVFARLAATNPVGTYSGNVTIASPGGTNKTVALAASTVTAKALTISGATATSRAFNGTNTVSVSGGSLVGVVGADAVTLGGTPAGTMANANAGTNKAVTVTGYSISGASATNYTLTQPTDVTVTITPATPTIATAPTATAITEGQALSASTFSGGLVTGVGGVTLGGNFAFTAPNTVPAVGTANQSVIFTPSDANYGTASGLASVTVNPAAPPLTSVGAKFSVSTNGVYTVVDSNNLPIEGATFAYLYRGRTNGVAGLNTNYAFMSYSNTNAPSAPGFYRVTATAGGAYTGTLTEDYSIAGPLQRDITTTRTATAITNNLARTNLMAAVQRVTTNSTLSTGTNGLTWTNPIAGFSTMANAATNPNSVLYVSASTIRLFVTNTNSVSDSLTVVISDGFTPVTFPVTVTATNGAATNLPSLTTTAVSNAATTFTNTGGTVMTNAPAGAVMTNVPTRMMTFMARPGRSIVIQFRHPETSQWVHVTRTNLPFISAGNQPLTNAETRPAIFTPRNGVIRILVDTNLSGWQARPAQ